MRKTLPLTVTVLTLALLPMDVRAASNAGSPHYISDAFGLVPYDNYAASYRSNWSGHVSVFNEGRLDTLAGQTQESDHYNQPAEPDPETLLVFVGPKSARAGVENVHASVIGLDRWGNLIPDGTITRIDPGFDEAVETTSQRGVSDRIFTPPTRTGTYRAGISVANRQAAHASYKVVTDLDSIELELAPQASPIEQETATTLTTRPIQDAYGNPVEEGIAVALTIDHDTGSVSRLNALTSQSVAAHELIARGLPDGLKATLSLGSTRSASSELDYRPLMIRQVPELGWTYLPAIEAMEIHVGPFMTDAGFLLNDGSPVSLLLTFTDGSQKEASGWLEKGYFRTLITAKPDKLPAEVTLTTASTHYESRLDLTDQRQATGEIQ
ncbi:hypothetical protein LL947_02430 [Halomonas sp. BLK-85]